MDMNKYEDRHKVELAIAEQIIKSALAAGYTVGVNDGEETTLRRSTDAAAIVAAMFTTDEDYLLIYEAGEKGKKIGWVRLIYGNTGWDVVNDYTVNLEEMMQPAQKLADSYEAGSLAENDSPDEDGLGARDPRNAR